MTTPVVAGVVGIVLEEVSVIAPVLVACVIGAVLELCVLTYAIPPMRSTAIRSPIIAFLLIKLKIKS